MIKQEAKQKFKWLARLGYGSRGVVYLVVGGLAIMTALGQGGKTTGSRGAMLEILEQPFGTTLMTLMVIGLFGYVIWRAIQAIKDPDGHGSSAKGIGVRLGLMASSVTHAALALWAVSILLGSGSGGGQGGSSQGGQWLASDWGQVAMVAIGIAFVAAGIAHIYKGWTARFERYMQIPAKYESWAQPTCRFGLIARGVVWCILAWFFIRSAMVARGGEIQGMEQALASLRDNAYGPWLLGIVAAGLFAFGVYSILEALYRRIQTA